MLRLKINQTGDTIVEVLIAMVIIGSVLVISFLAVNNSTSSNRRSQERSEALQLLQNQIEYLRYMATNGLGASISGNSQIITNGQAFCISNATNLSSTFPPFNQSTNVSMLNMAPYQPECAIAPNGPGTQPEYFIEIVDAKATDDPTLPDDTFRATAVWAAVGSSGNDTATIDYRINL